MKIVPWTDRCGPQNKYARQVKRWSSFHDVLSAANPSHIPANLGATLPVSQCYGRAADLVCHISGAEFIADNGINLATKILYKRGPLPLVSDVHQNYNTLNFLMTEPFRCLRCSQSYNCIYNYHTPT